MCIESVVVIWWFGDTEVEGGQGGTGGFVRVGLALDVEALPGPKHTDCKYTQRMTAQANAYANANANPTVQDPQTLHLKGRLESERKIASVK